MVVGMALGGDDSSDDDFVPDLNFFNNYDLLYIDYSLSAFLEFFIYIEFEDSKVKPQVFIVF